MTWLWLVRTTHVPTEVVATAALSELDGRPAGHLSAVAKDADQPDGGVKVAAGIIDPEGDAAQISLVQVPADRRILFDDGAVGDAIRRVLLLPPARTFSTLSLHDDRWAGSITASEDPTRLADDPFRFLAPAETLRIAAGLLGRTGPLPGPVMQRFGSGTPWPG